MVEKQEEMKDLLLKMKDEILKGINKAVKSGTESGAGEPTGDIYDQASSERDRELGLLLNDRERGKLRQIDEALIRIEDDEYGVCEECEEEIPLGRLKVMPFARFCVRCQSDMEKLQAQTKRFEEERAFREITFGEEEEG
ncbi:MAG: TraR/DksA family transcriptional regulator [Desulfuromonadales bacterium]|nr:MAG: TraR/DksA family transcriptional regulator [Desulfuromonadales bacterium]